MLSTVARRIRARAEGLKRHPNVLVRRSAQAVLLGLLAVRVGRGGVARSPEAAGGPPGELIGDPSFVAGVRDYLMERGLLRPWLGLVGRLLVLRELADARMYQLTHADHRTFVLRVDGAINQLGLRNLLIWQNHVLHCRPGAGDDPPFDIMLMLSSPTSDEPRLFEVISAALMLERIRNVTVFWDDKSLEAAMPMFMSRAERARWSQTRQAHDLLQLSPEIIDRVEQNGTSGGVKLLPDGRKRVQDFFKAALPGQVIIAVGLREDDDGTVDPDDLGLWLPLLDAAAARHSNVAFVVLNRVAPSQWQAWPSHVRFARHQGLSMQDALCLAQIADGYAGVLDIFGLTANAAARPGVYVLLTDGDRQRPLSDKSAGAPTVGQIMVGSRDRAAIATAMERFISTLPQTSVGNYAADKA